MRYMRPGKLSKPLLFFTGCFFLILLCQRTQAQFSVGVDAGYDKNYLITNNANRAFTNYRPLSGFTIGVPVQYKVTDWFAIATDPAVIQKNYRQVRSDFFAGVYENTFNTYLQVPLMSHFMFGGRQLKGFVNAGAYAGYWLTSRVSGMMPNVLDLSANETSGGSVYDYNNPYSYNEKYTFDSRKDRRLEAGWLGGMGASYNISGRYEVFSEARLLYSFTDQQKNYATNQVPRYNSTYGIHAGVLLHFDKQHSGY